MSGASSISGMRMRRRISSWSAKREARSAQGAQGAQGGRRLPVAPAQHAGQAAEQVHVHDKQGRRAGVGP